MKVGLIIVLGASGLFLFGPIGLIVGVVIGCTSSIVGANKGPGSPAPHDPLLDSAMRKIKAEGDARRAARNKDAR